MHKLKVLENIGRNCLSWGAATAANARLSYIKCASSNTLSCDSKQEQYKGKYERKAYGKPPYRDAQFAPPYRDGWSTPMPPSESEQQFLVRAKLDPDNFGEPETQWDTQDAGDMEEERHFAEQPLPSQKLSTAKYANMIKGFIRQRKIKEAIDVLEVRMLKEDRVKPENYIYNLVLGGCGRVGYTKKAFMLYNDMKKRNLKVTAGTYTALFNACANSPWREDGLNRAKHLYDIMIEKGDTPNDTNYNAMIKAFGRCGDLPMAFALADRMANEGQPIKDDTINFLLQSCIADKEAGFRHALLVWRKMVEKRVRPTIYTFNLLLRCVRDCGLGDLETSRDVIGRLIEAETVGEPNMRLELVEGTGSNALVLTNRKPEADEKGLDLRPNLLAPIPHLGSVLSILEIKNPQDRLLLLGGAQGFIDSMLDYKCAPDIKTFTLLLSNIPSTLAAEKEMIIMMKKLNIQPDIDFYNMLIKAKSMRLDYEGARQVLKSMKQLKMRPDLVTYGVLALGCKTKEEGLDLVDEMCRSGYRLNAVILGTMMKQACFHAAFDYIFEVMELCLKESVPVNKMFLGHLEAFKKWCRGKLNSKELDKKQVKMYGVFKNRLETWLTEVQIDDSEDAHPWQQYRQVHPHDVNFKPKDSARFKARRASRFKVKTSGKHRSHDS